LNTLRFNMQAGDHRGGDAAPHCCAKHGDDTAASIGHTARMATIGKRSRRHALAAVAVAAAAPATASIHNWPPLPPPRPPEFAPAQPAPAPPAQPDTQASTCLSKLVADGARAEPALLPAATAEGCGIASPIRLSSVTVASGDTVGLPDRPTVECAFALVLADYIRLIVAPLGEAMLRAKVASIETGPGYECRSRDHLAGAKISAHAKGLAVDVFAVEFADKRRVLVERQAGADETSYVRALRTAACGWFTTVLGPGSDSFHANHMHVDIESHGSSGSYRICE
jgi:hypothetical protein